MLTKKVLINTLGAKIAPYGFGYDGFEGNVWRFLRTINGENSILMSKKRTIILLMCTCQAGCGNVTWVT